MGIFSRMTDVFKANVNDVLDKAENPEKMIKQMVIEMEESVNKSTLAVAQSVSNAKSLEKKISKAKKSVEDWNEKAKHAINAGRDDLAKAALEKRSLAQKNINDLEPLYTSAKQTADNLRSQLEQIKNKLDEARNRQNTLIARARSAEAQKQISQSISGVGSDAFSKFDKLEQKVETMESEAEVHAELAGDNNSLEDEFKALESGGDAETELLKMKSEMGLLGDGK